MAAVTGVFPAGQPSGDKLSAGFAADAGTSRGTMAAVGLLAYGAGAWQAPTWAVAAAAATLWRTRAVQRLGRARHTTWLTVCRRGHLLSEGQEARPGPTAESRSPRWPRSAVRSTDGAKAGNGRAPFPSNETVPPGDEARPLARYPGAGDVVIAARTPW